MIPEVKLFLSLKGGRLRGGGMRVEGWWVFCFFKLVSPNLIFFSFSACPFLYF